MNILDNLWSAWCRKLRRQSATKQDLAEMEKRIMAKQADITNLLTQTTERITKIGTETRSLLDKIDALQKQIADLDNVSPELEAASKALADQVAVVDDLVPDAA